MLVSYAYHARRDASLVGTVGESEHIMSDCPASVSLRIHQRVMNASLPRLARHSQFSINATPFTHPLRAHDDDAAAAAAAYHTDYLPVTPFAM